MPGVDLERDHEQFRNNQGGEGDADNVDELTIEQENGKDDDRAALVDADQHPREERLEGESAALQQLFVQFRITLHNGLANILVQDQREDRGHRVNRRITKRTINVSRRHRVGTALNKPKKEEALIYCNRSKVKDAAENPLNDGNDEPAMNNELTELRGSLV